MTAGTARALPVLTGARRSRNEAVSLAEAQLGPAIDQQAKAIVQSSHLQSFGFFIKT
jgi:hypothetical protein